MPPNRFESEVESFLEGSHGDRTHIKRADHHTVTPLCGTLLLASLAAPLTGDYGPAARDISPGHASIHAHVNPIGGCVGRLPTMPPMGFSCTLKG